MSEEPRHEEGFPQTAAVLFDRDGTLVHDVPYNGDPAQVRPVVGARTALDELRRSGMSIGVVSNQSGVSRGVISAAEVAAVNARVEELLGVFDIWEVCPHGVDDGCACRKPRPGLILSAARRMGVPVGRVVVIGDIGSDVEAAAAAGARPILVPTPATRDEEVRAAPEVAPDLLTAGRLATGRSVLSGCGRAPAGVAVSLEESGGRE